MAVEAAISEEVKKNAIDLMITMVVDELSQDLQKKPSEVLLDFAVSKTGQLLYDEQSKLWWSGPSDIAEMYKREISQKHDVKEAIEK